MSHHDTHAPHVELDPVEADANSRADAWAMFALVAIVVTLAIFFVSR